ncbi:MAG TPA: alpha/beta fold hydrolase [Verrucomicrobiae bacterium]|nr:alpha/beta fold hydrolase [Verrucomicrobiae bacterium]
MKFFERAFAPLIVTATVPLLCSCSIIGLKRQVTKLEQRGTIGVVLYTPPGRSFPTYAFAWTHDQSGALASVGFQTVGDIGIAPFNLLTSHKYGIAVFTDVNRSGKYERGEPLAYQENVRPSPFTDPNTPLQVVSLALARSHRELPEAVTNRPAENRALGTALRASLGEVASPEDERFNKQKGSAGMWRPCDFLSESTLGIYFTESYDPDRIPVLFVHGIGGTPQDFRYMMENFDRTRYQLWFFHYPSAVRLGRVSGAMAKGLQILHTRLGFKECYIVAHSMGGLVSANSLQELNKAGGTNFVTRFITISTPFGGHEAAALGVRHLSKPVPSWIDVAPRSAFLQGLEQTPLPLGTRYDLIYGDTGKHDGVVSVASQLEPHNRAKAATVTRFALGHEQILNEATVVNRILGCLGAEKPKVPPTSIALRD